MTDPNYFKAAAKERTVPRQRAGFQWCKCGHVEPTHFAMVDFVSNDGDTLHHEPYRCHAAGCKCWRFIENRSLRSRIRRKIGTRKK